jgi:hypothetical protein
MRRAAAVLAVPLLLGTAVAGTAHADAPRLVGEWRFDDGSGTVARDTSGSSLDGMLGTGDDRPAWIAGVDGTALHFDGNDAVTVPNSAVLEKQVVTVTALVRASASPGPFRYVFSKGANKCQNGSYGLYTGADGGASFYVYGNAGTEHSPSVPPALVWNGQWHQLAGVYDGSMVRLYVDGTEIGGGTPYTGGIRYDLAHNEPLIGSYVGDGCLLSFSGDIDTVRIWNGALTADQVAFVAPAPNPAGGGSSGGGSTAGGGSGGGSSGGGTSDPQATCTTVRVAHPRLRAGHRARLVVSVRTGGHRRRHVRVTVSAKRLRLAARTGKKGTASFHVRPRPSQRKLTVRAAVRRPQGCPAPTARLRVRR